MNEMKVASDSYGFDLCDEVVFCHMIGYLLLHFCCELLFFLWVGLEEDGGGYQFVAKLFCSSDVSFHELFEDDIHAWRRFHNLFACL